MGWVPTLPWMILNLGRLHREGPLIMQKIDKNLRYKFAVGRLTQLILIDLFCFIAIFSVENPTWKFFQGGTSLKNPNVYLDQLNILHPQKSDQQMTGALYKLNAGSI